MALLEKARPYNQRVAAQVNAAYDTRLFDCSAVMCRRLIESLIIDAYEHAKRDGDIKAVDGNFLMLNGLVSKIKFGQRSQHQPECSCCLEENQSPRRSVGPFTPLQRQGL